MIEQAGKPSSAGFPLASLYQYSGVAKAFSISETCMRLEHEPIESTTTSTGLTSFTHLANSRMWLIWKPRRKWNHLSFRTGSMSLSCRSRFSFESV